MNLTVTIDDELLRRARTLARQRGVSLQQLVRDYLETLVGLQSGDQIADELLALMSERGGHSGGRRIRRDDAYDGRL